MHRPAQLHPIGHVATEHREVAATPSQATETDAPARVAVLPEYVDGLLGLERYEFVWLITWLDRQPSERPLRVVPRTTEATGELQGVFASRFPYRPNGIGLSLVRVLEIADDVITVRGADLLDGTPVLDIKPWFADCDDPGALPG
jgi:tRNA-Thr(GGU) m(6)t(6)A37 methyltransferase TsaA